VSVQRARALVRAWPLLFALAGTACSWLVNPEKDAPRCAIDGGTDPCQEGMECLAGRCYVKDCSGPEICGDKIDNDCDGETDEETDTPEMCNFIDDDCDGKKDEDFDRDGDEFTWCGDHYDDDTKDCDEINPNVNPSAAEVCDGIDNNCDQRVDEFSADKPLCTKPEECFGGRCIVPSCAIEGSGPTCRDNENCVNGECVSNVCNTMTCPPGSYCDIASGTCTTPPAKAKNGGGCSTNSDCLSGLCIDAAALRMPGNTGRICGEACCQDKDCTVAGEICFASGTGARSCLPRTEVPSAKMCSNDRGCTPPERCVIGRVTQTGNEARAAFSTGVCGAPAPNENGLGQACLTNQSCISKLCVPDPLSFLGACSVPCQISTDCSGLHRPRGGLFPEAPSDAPREYCRVVDLSLLAGGPADATDHVAACVMGFDTGEKGFAEPCNANNECADGVCIMSVGGKAGYCAPTCCKNAQCQAITSGTDARCIPMARGKHYEMRCSL
jgi:hypothetical protein